MDHIWEVLKIEPTSDKRQIRKAYAALTKIYHVEEHPEEFSEIQQAYRAALEQAEAGEQKTPVQTVMLQEAQKEEPLLNEPKQKANDSILAKLEVLHQQQKSAYSSQEVIDQIVQLLLSQDVPDRQQMWQEFFLTDAFLFVHDNDGFVDELVDAICACPHLSIEKLEPIFVKELALVYSIISFGDIRDEAYNFGNKEAMIRIIFGQDDNAWVYTEKDIQLDNRRYAYFSFRKIRQLAEEGGLKTYQLEKWGNLAFYAEDNYCPKIVSENVPKWERRPEQVMEPYAPACVAMHTYLVRHYEIPENVCHAMRNNFEVDGRMGEYPLCSYEAVYDQMCQKYPRMRQSEAASLTDWKIGLLSDPPVFTKRMLDLETMEWLIQLLTIRACSKELTKMIYDAYESEGEWALPLLELLIGRLCDCENQERSGYNAQEAEKELGISTQNQDFWSYFLSVAYPYSNDGREPKDGDYHTVLSHYMKRVYPVSDYFATHFFKKETPMSQRGTMHGVMECGRTEKTISFDGAEIRIVFTPHHLEYTLQGVPVFYQTLPFSELSKLSESEEDMITFFLLLPITKVSVEKGCREEILRRMRALPFYKETWNYLADCMIRNTDWETKPEHPQKVLEEVYYSENTWNCFRGKLTGRKFQVDYQTPKGWYPMKLLYGESKKVRAIEDKSDRLNFMHQVVDGFLPPETVLLREIFVAGMTPIQKAKVIFDALVEIRHMDGKAKGKYRTPQRLDATQNFLEQWDSLHFGGHTCSVLLWFGKKEENTTPLHCYMFAHDDWDAFHTLFEMRGEVYNAYLKREVRLARRIMEPSEIVGYFRVEDIVPFPIGIGESGRFYSYFAHQFVMAQSFAELVTKCVDLEPLDRIELDKGFRTRNKFTGKLENWYYHEYIHEKNEVLYNYPYELYRELFEEV